MSTRTTNIHPFPARMAPELALEHLKSLRKGSLVLDPMAGSGTVISQAAALGHRAIGFDLDPLAVLMTSVSTTSVDLSVLDELTGYLVKKLENLSSDRITLPWIDNDSETTDFIKFWFAPLQINTLRKLAYVFFTDRKLKSAPREANVLRLGMSKIIVTKDRGASLARDVSHSRPHKVADTNDYDVLAGFQKAVIQLRKQLHDLPAMPGVSVSRGDARLLKEIKDHSVDTVMTSPPYLNAIDYLRGHKLSLVWLGYRISDIRKIRSVSIGAERSPDVKSHFDRQKMIPSFGDIKELPCKYSLIIERYADDLFNMVSEVKRVVKPNGRAVFVIGNSCLHGVFIKNSSALAKAATLSGLHLVSEHERELPASSRYLPMPSDKASALGKRMRTECILVFSA